MPGRFFFFGSLIIQDIYSLPPTNISVSGKAALAHTPSSDITISIVIKRATICRSSAVTVLSLAASVVWEELGFAVRTNVRNMSGLSMLGGAGE